MNRSIDQKTRAELEEIAARYPQKRSGLLPMLHLVQSVAGQITPEGIEACAEILEISAAEVSGVATFYTMYKRRPVGDYHVGVCTNTLCAIMGGDLIFERLKDHLDVGNDETTEDGKIGLMGTDRLTGKPLLIDKLKPELGGQLVKLVADDMERAAKEREAKKAKKKSKSKR